MSGKFPSMIIKGYQRYINNTEFSIEDGLPYWRERIFNGLMMVFMLFGTLAMIPNIIASIVTKSHLITITDIIIYLNIIHLFFNHKIRFRIKITIVIFFIYLLSIVLLITLGPLGPGFVWLASSSLIAALLVGMRASIITIIINTCVIVALAFLIHLKVFHNIFFDSYTPLTWIAVSLNVIVFNAITSIPLALLIQALEGSLQNEKQLKTELIKRNKIIEGEKNLAQESDKLKSAFLANLSHEIRTPMNAIVGFSELIHNETTREDKLNKYSIHVIQNSRYLLNLINDIVDISIIESGQIVLIYQSLTLGKIIDEIKPTIDTSSLRKTRSDVEILYLIPSSLYELELYIDGTRLKQILINLITNALKYTVTGSVKIKITKTGHDLNFVVSDSGVGIPLNEQEKIFQRFSKIDRKNNFTMPGIGLGLSITKGLCEAMQGKIWFESEANKGTNFHFTLPITKPVK